MLRKTAQQRGQKPLAPAEGVLSRHTQGIFVYGDKSRSGTLPHLLATKYKHQGHQPCLLLIRPDMRIDSCLSVALITEEDVQEEAFQDCKNLFQLFLNTSGVGG